MAQNLHRNPMQNVIASTATPPIGPRYLIASLIAHGAIAAAPFGGPGIVLPNETPVPIQITWRSPADRAPSELPAEVRRPAPVPRPESRRIEIATASPVTPPTRRPEIVPPANPAPPSFEETAEPTPAADFPTEFAEQPVVVARADPSEAIMPLHSGPSDLHLLERYTRDLIARVNEHRQYPMLARVRGWQGTVIVDVRIGAVGEVVSLAIARSAGHEVLDQQAMQMIRDASPLPAPAHADASQPLLVQLPITFSLR